MKIWAITMIADEVDVVVPSLEHMISEGVTGIIVADNLSIDGTGAKLKEFVKIAPIPIIVLQDNEFAFYQGKKLTGLAKLAAEQGAEWIVPFDIDELWCGLEKPLAQAIEEEGKEVAVLGVRSFTYYPTGYDLLEEENPFLRMQYRRIVPSTYPKLTYLYDERFELGQGSDAVYLDGGMELPWHVPEIAMKMAHFPVRSLEQFIAKMKRGSAAYKASNLPSNFGAHRRAYGRILERYGEDALRIIFFHSFFAGEPWREGLELDPPLWCKWKGVKSEKGV